MKIHQICYLIIFKGYLLYRTLTSQNMPSDALVKNFFYFIEKLCKKLAIP